MVEICQFLCLTAIFFFDVWQLMFNLLHDFCMKVNYWLASFLNVLLTQIYIYIYLYLKVELINKTTFLWLWVSRFTIIRQIYIYFNYWQESLDSGSLFTHPSFPEISQCCVLLPVFFCDQKGTVRWRVKYLRRKVQRAIHGVTFNRDMKTGQTNMRLTDIPCHYITVGCLNHNLRSTLKTPSLSLYAVSPSPASTIFISPYSKTQSEGKLNWV